MPEQTASPALERALGLIGQRRPKKTGSAGVMTLYADSGFRIRFRSIVPLAVFAALVPIIAGCKGSPSADVVATVNGKEISRSDLDRIYKANLNDSTQK